MIALMPVTFRADVFRIRNIDKLVRDISLPAKQRWSLVYRMAVT
jgi:hypothetical protein